MAKAKPNRSVGFSLSFHTIFHGNKVNHTSIMMDTTTRKGGLALMIMRNCSGEGEVADLWST